MMISSSRPTRYRETSVAPIGKVLGAKLDTGKHLPIRALFGIIIVGALAVGGTQIVRSVSSPRLSISGVTDGQSVNSHTVTISGEAPKSEHLHINGIATPMTPGGKFTTTLALSPGFNILTFSTENNRGKKTTRQFVLTKSHGTESPPSFSILPFEPDETATYQN